MWNTIHTKRRISGELEARIQNHRRRAKSKSRIFYWFRHDCYDMNDWYDLDDVIWNEILMNDTRYDWYDTTTKWYDMLYTARWHKMKWWCDMTWNDMNDIWNDVSDHELIHSVSEVMWHDKNEMKWHQNMKWQNLKWHEMIRYDIMTQMLMSISTIEIV